MLKRVAAAGALVLVAAAALYLFAGWRIALDGSGMWPRLDHAPDFNALDAERSRQQAANRSPTAQTEDIPTGVANAPAPASPAAPAVSSSPKEPSVEAGSLW